MREDPIRVVLPAPPASFIADDDVAASVTATPRYARRFSMDVAEEALAQMGPRAIGFVAQRLAENVVYRHQDAIERAVYSYLNNPAWAEPVIRDAIYRAVAQFARELFDDTKHPPHPGGTAP